MTFLERLRSYLERVEAAPEGLAPLRVDVAAHRRHFIAERDGLGPNLTKNIRERVDRLSYLLPAFVNDVAARLREELVPDCSEEELARLINLAISFEMLAPASSGSRSRDAEIKRIAREGRWWSEKEHAGDSWWSPARYAFEIRATRRRGERALLTPIGRTLIDLPGSDATRWLLALESAQSLGPKDDFRVSPEFAAELVSQPHRMFEPFVSRGVEPWPYSWATIRRLDALQLLRYEPSEEPDDAFGYTVFERARPLLEEISERRPTPFAVLADALLRDEVAHTMSLVRPDPAQALRESAAAATALQARMVVHEIRNALIPARVALSSLLRDLGDAAQGAPAEKQRARIEAGLQRALSFADDMLRVANLGAEHAASFDLAAAVREAAAGMANELNGSLRVAPAAEVPPVVGPRSQFVLALVNLLRNAAQAIAGRGGTVEIAVEAGEQSVVVSVDDSGPGVPTEHREAIFDAGFALRPGGSGQGLALVRQVVEREMGGTVRCEDSPFGGARFTLVIPVREPRQP